MTADQHEKIRGAVAKHNAKYSFPVAISGLLTVGVINVIHAWQKRDMLDAAATVIIFFVIGPLVVWLVRKTIGPEIDD